MNTKRSKRWDGSLNTLTPDYLKDVIEKMQAYGDRVQFDLLPSKGQRPSYQVINPSDRKMGFDGKHFLTSLDADGNVSENLSAVFSLDAVKAALVRGNSKPATTPRARVSRTSSPSSASRPVTAAAAVVDEVERDKYAYFKANREALPEGIQKYSTQISELMRSGISAENAFDNIIKQHF